MSIETIYVMGVSGCGKSTIGELLATKLGWHFVDGDSFHPAANVEKMRAGVPLSDDDRRPWLECIANYASEHPRTLIPCSALKRVYRDILRGSRSCRFVFLRVPRDELERRMATRENHFMPPSLLDSQLQTLEDPSSEDDVVTVDYNNQQPEEIVDRLAVFLNQQAKF